MRHKAWRVKAWIIRGDGRQRLEHSAPMSYTDAVRDLSAISKRPNVTAAALEEVAPPPARRVQHALELGAPAAATPRATRQLDLFSSPTKGKAS